MWKWLQFSVYSAAYSNSFVGLKIFSESVVWQTSACFKDLQNVKIIWPLLYYIIILSDPAFKTPCVLGRNKRIVEVKYASTKYLLLQSRQHALQITAESGSCSSRYARCWHARRHTSMYFDIYQFRKIIPLQRICYMCCPFYRNKPLWGRSYQAALRHAL